MQSSKIQAFNSQFTAYEGEIKGSQVNDLIKTVLASNATDSSHQVAVAYKVIFNPGMTINILRTKKIENGKKYNISMRYSADGSSEYTRILYNELGSDWYYWKYLVGPNPSTLTPKHICDEATEKGYIFAIVVEEI